MEELIKEYSGKVPEKILNDFEKEIKNYSLSKEKIKNALAQIEKEYNDAKISPGEAIGIITAESFGEPSTQMSISYFEKVIIKLNNKIKILEIGRFVDELINKLGSYKINSHTDILPLDDYEVLVPSINQGEKIEWKKVVEVSKHKSPNKLMEITTASGRKIIATDNHSFVTRINNMIVPISGRRLNVGDRVPVMKYLPEHCTSSITVSEYVDLPDKDSSIVTKAYNTLKLIPSKLKLDWDFGWFIGAYLAEGTASYGCVIISNLDNNYINNAKRFVSKLGLDYIEKYHDRGFSDSRDFVVNSSLLARFIKNICNVGSSNKKVPEFAFSAKEDFIGGLLRGYFDGDGNFTVARKMIRASSNSEELIDGIKLLLTRFGIFAFKSKDYKQYYLIIPYKYAPIFLKKIGSNIEYKMNSLKKLATLANKNILKRYRDHTDMISGFNNILVEISIKLGLPTRYVNSATKRQKIGRTALLRHIMRFENATSKKNINISSELGILYRMLNSDVIWDAIEKIEYMDKDNEYVYDLSVPGLETFTTFDGIITHNTLNVFHFAGVAEVSVTLGLPRLIEIFDARKELSTPAMEIYLNKEISKDSEKVRKIASSIKETKLREIVSEFSINLVKMQVELSLNKKKMRDITLSVKDLVGILSSTLKEIGVRESGDKIILKLKNEYEKLVDIYKLKEKVKDIYIKGIEKITHVLPIKRDNEFVILTAGSNLKEVLNLKYVDGNRTKTNNLFEIANVLGIEAARQSIIEESLSVIEEQGLDIDIRHIMFIADLMTNSGSIKGVTRSGITSEKESVLARASFETPIKHIVNASLVGEEDFLNSVVENVMLNQPVPLGTGLPDLVTKVKKNE